MTKPFTEFGELDARSREIFRHIVETYIETGAPVGSRFLSKSMPDIALSSASIRNVMADLEALNLLFAPHTSAGRVPTETGLRLFVDALLEVGDLSPEERRHIKARIGSGGTDRTVEDALEQATNLLSDLSRCASLVLTPQSTESLKHVEFVSLEPGRALVVLVSESGKVENRLIDVPAGLPPSALSQASNYFNARLRNRTLDAARAEITRESESQQAELDKLTRTIVEQGLAVWIDIAGGEKSLIVRGRSNLLEDLNAVEDLDRVRQLFDDLENKKDLIELLGLADAAEGVRIFIGSENKLFSLKDSSVIMAPYHDGDNKVVGILGVIGPTRLNYARIIPMVDFTARVVGKLVG